LGLLLSLGRTLDIARNLAALRFDVEAQNVERQNVGKIIEKWRIHLTPLGSTPQG
jgi:hypothetical protein